MMMDCGFTGNPIPPSCDRNGGDDNVIRIIGSECPVLGKIAMPWWKGRHSEIQHCKQLNTAHCTLHTTHQTAHSISADCPLHTLCLSACVFVCVCVILKLLKSITAGIKCNLMLWWNHERHSRSRRGLQVIGLWRFRAPCTLPGQSV